MFNQMEQWAAERCGKFTASEISKLLVSGKKGDYFGVGAKTYIRTKAAEILTMEPNNGGKLNTYAMEWGLSNEFDAVQRFEKETGFTVEYYGGGNPKFFNYSNFSGGSPDGIIGNEAIIEVKCPYNSGEHIEHSLLNDADDLKDYAPEYYYQIQANMLFTGTDKAYFISFDPRFIDEHLQIKILEIPANEDDFILLKERISEAEKSLSVIIETVRESVTA